MLASVPASRHTGSGSPFLGDNWERSEVGTAGAHKSNATFFPPTQINSSLDRANPGLIPTGSLPAGLKITEVEIDLRHRATGTDLGGQLHRAKQLRDVTRALAARGLVQSGVQELKDGGVSGLVKRLRSGR